MIKPYDITIIGGGIAGLTLACLLKDSALKILIIDKSPLPDKIPEEYALRVSAINQASKKVLADAGVWENILTQRHAAFKHMHVWNNQGEVNFSGNNMSQKPLGFIIENPIIQYELASMIKASKNISTIAHTSPELLHHFHDSVQLLLENGERIETKLLVGADGALSWLRQHLNISHKEKNYQHSAIVANVSIEKPHKNTAWQCFSATGPLALLPMSDHHTCSIVWSQDTEIAAALMQDDTKTFNQKITANFQEKLGAIELISERKSFPLIMRHAEHYIENNIALVGDAIHTIHPLAGLGLNLGLQDVTCLATIIKDNPTSFNQFAVLKKYQRQRRLENTLIMNSMSGFKQLFQSKHTLVDYFRNQGLNLTDQLPWLKSFFLQRANMD